MFSKLFALFALLAAANASAIPLVETKFASVPIAKTSILGPSGEITKEEHLPVVARETAAIVETPVVRVAHETPVVRLAHETPVVAAKTTLEHHDLTVLHPPHITTHHEVLPAHHEIVEEHHETLPIYEEKLPLLKSYREVPLVKALPLERPVFVKTLPTVSHYSYTKPIVKSGYYYY